MKERILIAKSSIGLLILQYDLQYLCSGLFLEHFLVGKLGLHVANKVDVDDSNVSMAGDSIGMCQ